MGTAAPREIRAEERQPRVSPPPSGGRIETFLQAKGSQVSPQIVNHLRGYLGRALTPRAAPTATRAPTRSRICASARSRSGSRTTCALTRSPCSSARSTRAGGRSSPAIYTGLRKGELLALRKADVDLAWQSYGGALARPRHHQGRPRRRHPGRDRARAVPARRHRGVSVGLVFPRQDGSMMRRDVNIEQTLRRALGRADVVEGYRHVCRRKGCG